ncbi:MAG: hypothetical protein ACK56I_09400, partial [bacterium]
MQSFPHHEVNKRLGFYVLFRCKIRFFDYVEIFFVRAVYCRKTKLEGNIPTEPLFCTHTMTMYYPDYEFYNGEGFLLLYQIEMQFICGINSPRQLPEMPLQEIQYSQEKEASLSRG